MKIKKRIATLKDIIFCGSTSKTFRKVQSDYSSAYIKNYSYFRGSVITPLWNQACFFRRRHTYIHNQLLQPFRQDCNLVSQTTYVSGVNYNLRTNVRFLRIFSLQFCLLLEFLVEIRWKEFNFHFILMSDLDVLPTRLRRLFRLKRINSMKLAVRM